MLEVGLHRKVWQQFNRLLDYIDEISPRQGFGIRLSRTPNGTMITATPGESDPGEPGQAKQCRVKQVLNDYLVCAEFDGSSEGAQILVAKPYDLRSTGWNGITVVYTLYPSGTISISYNYLSPFYRTASNQVGTSITHEDQHIVPYYVPDKSVIYAMQSVNGTGVSSADEWIDVNTDGRAWARVA